jgi:hypothetical protein
MKGKEIINYIVRARMPDREHVRETCIRQSASTTSAKRKVWVTRTVSVVACTAVVFAGVLVFHEIGKKTPPTAINNPDGINSINNGNYAVYVPAIELPNHTNGIEMDMIGLFVYKGRIYTQTAWYYDEEASAISGLVGERLGYAKGNINEWSKQDDYAVEFAGSAAGDVYSVRGYDQSFRLCMKGSYTDDNGTAVHYINFYENLTHIGLTFGSDFFGGRLQLSENWKYVKYQKHDNGNNALDDNYVFNDLEGVADEDIAMFIRELYSGNFESAYHSNPDIYTDSKQQAHLKFYMDDNTVIEIRLIEGGYAGYHHLGWSFVKMPSDTFDLIFNACQ